MKITYIRGIPHRLSDCGEYYEPIKESEEYIKYKEGCDKQIEEWLKGNPIHNYWHENEEYGECTPCMSCCLGIKYLWPYELRKKFVDGNDELRSAMLLMTLNTLTVNKELDVYIAGNVNSLTQH